MNEQLLYGGTKKAGVFYEWRAGRVCPVSHGSFRVDDRARELERAWFISRKYTGENRMVENESAKSWCIAELRRAFLLILSLSFSRSRLARLLPTLIERTCRAIIFAANVPPSGILIAIVKEFS